MREWNGHYIDYDYTHPEYTIEILTGIREYTVRNVDWARENNDSSGLDYFVPKLSALDAAIAKLSK